MIDHRALGLTAGRGQRRGFTLAEILVVLSIICVLMLITSIGFESIVGTEFDSQVSDLATILLRARVYAMANNTYAFVGITETDASVSSSTVPQTAGNGRIGVVTVASNDGTCGYPSTAPAGLSASALTVVAPLRHFDNLHLLAGSGISSLPNSGTGSTYNIQSTNSLTTFQWPLTGTAQYSFGATPGSIIQFNPQGEAQIMPTGTTSNTILQWIEIDLEPIHGNVVSSKTANTAAILIVGTSGAVTLYRK
jgi:prepilin-type N-terminal cleavage/methylation domain-containing protein